MRKLIMHTEQELTTKLLNLGNYVLNSGDFNQSPTV